MLKIETKDNRVIVFVGLLMASLFLFHFSGADDNKLGYFQDRDQDGLSDEEEKALGTDWQKADTDGDGYTDGVEVSSGYDPLVPAPGDKLSDDKIVDNKNFIKGNEGVKKKQKNLTQEFIAKLRAKKGVAIETFKNSNENGLVTSAEDINKLKGVSLTEKDIQDLAKETVGDIDIDAEIKEIDDKELNILSKVKANSGEKKQKKIKKEIENYLAETGYIMINNLPFNANSAQTFNDKLDRFMIGIGQDIVTGNDLETKQSKSKLRDLIGQLKQVEVPYVLKDVHKRAVSLLQYLADQNEEIVFQKDDPIAMGVMIGRLQAIMTEMQDVQAEMDGILLKYNVEVESDVKSQKLESEDKLNN
jgi:hypothetical protein